MMIMHLKLLAISLVTALLFPHSASAAAATDLMLTKTTSGTFTVGTTGTYILTVSNLGPASTDATITVVDDLPAGLGFVSATGSGWACSAAGQTVTCTNPNPLAAGVGTRITLSVSVSSAAYPTVTNQAMVSYAGDTNAGNNTSRRPTTIRQGQGAATATIPTPGATGTATPTPTSTSGTTPAATDVFVTKTVGKSFAVGSVGIYVLTVTNAGSAATNAPITVTDNLPASLGVVSATGAGWTCSASGQTVTCATADPVAAGATSSSITLTVSVGRAAYPTVTNSATVFYAGDTNLANNTARRPTSVRAQRALRPHSLSSRRPQHSPH